MFRFGNKSNASSSNRKKSDVPSSSRRRAESVASTASSRKPSRKDDRRGSIADDGPSSYRPTYSATDDLSGPSSYATAPDSRTGDRYESSRPVRHQSLTESAIRTLGGQDDDWEDLDTRSERRSRASTSDHKRRHRTQHRSGSDSQEREHKDYQDKPERLSEKSRGKRRVDDSSLVDPSHDSRKESSRGYDSFHTQVDAPGFSQFPGQYHEPSVNPQIPGRYQEPTVQSQLPGQYQETVTTPQSSYHRPEMSSHVQDQFPGQNPNQYAGPDFRQSHLVAEGVYGLAADYYGDQGQSVAHQPGIRPESATIIMGAQPHLMAASATPNPPQETGNGSAAEFFSGSTSQVSPSVKPPKPSQTATSSGKPPKTSKPSKPSGVSGKPDKPSKPNKTSSSAAAAAASGAALGYALNNSQQNAHEYTQHSTSQSYSQQASAATSIGSTPLYVQHQHSTSEPVIPSGEAYYAPPPSDRPTKPGKQPSNSHNSLYAAGAVGLAAGAYGVHQHNHQQAHQGHNHSASVGMSPSYYGRPPSGPFANSNTATQHRHKGPITKLVDWWKDYEDVRRMEEYTEYIGVCKYCFDPRTTVEDAPRRHNYSRRRSSDSLRRRSSDSLRRTNTQGSKHSRIDKDSRYYSSDNERRKKKTSWLGAGLAGYGLAKLWESNRDFDDTYSVKSGRQNRSSRHSERDGSVERKSHSEYGVIRDDHHHNHAFVRTKDGSVIRKQAHPNRSRSRSRDRKNGILGAAAAASLGASVANRRRSHSREKTSNGAFVRRQTDNDGRIYRSRSRSHSPGLGEILGFTKVPSARDRRGSPSAFLSNTSRTSDRQSGGMFGGFFSPAEKKHKEHRTEHRKKKKSFFTFANSSSSSSNSDLAFGNGVVKSRQTSRTNHKQKSDEHLNATLLGIGATAAALAAAKHGSRRKPEVIAVRENRERRSRQTRKASSERSDDEDGWESDHGSESTGSSLAFGDFEPRGNQVARRSSFESATSQSSGTSKWGWRWGNKSSKKHKSPTPPPAYPPRPDHPPSLTGVQSTKYATPPSGRSTMREETVMSNMSSPVSMQSMQYVHPIPISDPTTFDAAGHSSMPGAFPIQSPAITSRPGPGPIQQPQPVAPVHPSVYNAQNHAQTSYPAPTSSSTFASPNSPGIRRTQSSPITSHFARDAMVGAAAAAVTGSILSSSKGKTPRDEGAAGVRFELTEKQAKKEERAYKKQVDRKEDERRRSDLERAAKDEASKRAAQSERRELEEADHRRMIEEVARRESIRKAEQERQDEKVRLEAAAWMQTQLDAEAAKKRESELRRQDLAAAEAALIEQEHRQADDFYRLERERYERERDIEQEKAQRDREIDAEIERRRQTQHRGPEAGSSRDAWKVPLAAVVAGAVSGAAFESARERDDQDSRSKPSFQTRAYEPSDGRNGPPLMDDDLYDPEFFKRRRSPSDLSREAEISRKAADKVVSDLRDRYEQPTPSQAAFFAPEELSKPSKGKTAVADPIADNDVQVYRVPQIDLDHPNEPPPPYQSSPHFPGSGDKKFNDKPWAVPKLNVIAPTPPTSYAGSAKDDRSPVSPVTAPQAPGEQFDSSGERRKSSRVSWGQDQTRIYEVHTPESSQEQFISNKDLNDYSSAQDNNAAEKDLRRGEATGTASRSDDLPRFSKESASYEADPVGEISRDDEPLFGSESSYRRPFFQSVTDLGLGIDSPGTEGAPPVRGFVEGEVDEPTPVTEKLPHIPGGFEDDDSKPATTQDDNDDYGFPLSKKEKKKREKAAKRASMDDAFSAASLEPERSQPEPEPEPVFEAPVSKKEKKKREKAAMRAGFDEPATPASESEMPRFETETPKYEPEPEFDMPLSKKEKKKREKAALLASFDEPVPSPAEPEPSPYEPEPEFDIPLSKKDKKKREKAANRELCDTAFSPVVDSPSQYYAPTEPIVHEDDDYFLSKKDKKKREKAASRELDDPATSQAVESVSPHTIPSESVAVEDDDYFLSKKDKKKRDKAARASLAESDSAPPTPTVDDAPREPASSTAEPVDDSFLSKKDRKKRERAAKQTFEEEPTPSTPMQETVNDPEQQYDSFEIPLTKKEKKRREKLAKQSFSDTFEDEQSPASPASPAEEPSYVESNNEFELPLSAKEKKKRAKDAKRLGLDDAATALFIGGVTAAAALSRSDNEPSRYDERDPRDVEYPAEQSTPRESQDVSAIQTSPVEERRFSYPSNTYDDPEGFVDTKKSKKKSKRNSGISHSPSAASPLRTEIKWDDYVGPDAGRSESQEIDPKSDHDYPQTRDERREPTSQAEVTRSTELPSPESDRDMRSVVSAPIDSNGDASRHESRRSRHEDDDHDSSRRSRSVAASEPVDVYESSKKHKRKSKRESGDFDDTASVVSARSSRSRPDDEDAASKKEKKGGFLGLFRRKSSDTTPKAQEPEDEDDGDKKHKRHHRRKSSERESSSRSRHRDEYDVDDGKSTRSSESRHRSSHRDDDAPFDDYDDTRSQTSESRRRRKHRHRDESEEGRSKSGIDNFDDTRSQTSESRRKHRHHHRDGSEDDGRSRATNDGFDDTRSQTSESRRKHKSRHRDRDEEDDSRRSEGKSRDVEDAYYKERDQSFLGERVEAEELPPLPASSQTSPTLAPQSADPSSFSTMNQTIPPNSAVTVPELDLTTQNDHIFAQNDIPTAHHRSEADFGGPTELDISSHHSYPDVHVSEVSALPLSTSRPTSPMNIDSLSPRQDTETPRRPLIPLRPSSSTSVPLRFRRMPTSPNEQRDRSLSLSSPVSQPPDSPSSPRTRQGRPHSTEFKHSTEFRPLYLVERNRKPQETQVDEELPSLPSSRTTSRASSFQGSEAYESAVEEFSPSGDGSMTPEFPDQEFSDQREDVLDSQQTTPKASEFPPNVLDPRPRTEPEYYTWSDIEREERMHEQELEGEHSSHIIQGLTRAPMDPQQAHDYSAAQSHSEEPAQTSRSIGLRDTMAAALAGGVAGGILAHEATEVNEDPMATDIWGDDSDGADPEPFPTVDDEFNEAIGKPAEPEPEPERPILSRANSFKKGKKGKKAKDIKLGTASTAEPVETISPEEMKSRRRRDTEIAVDSWFNPAPVADVPKLGKKGKKRQSVGSGDQSSAEQTAATIPMETDARDVPLPETPLAATNDSFFPETQVQGESQDAEAQPKEGTPDEQPTPDEFTGVMASALALLTRKKSKKGKKKSKSTSIDNTPSETASPSTENVAQDTADPVFTDAVDRALEGEESIIEPPAGEIEDVPSSSNTVVPASMAVNEPITAEAVFEDADVLCKGTQDTAPVAEAGDVQKPETFDVPLSKTERKKKGKKGKQADIWADEPEASPIAEEEDSLQPETPVYEQSEPEFIVPKKKGKKEKKNQAVDLWADESAPDAGASTSEPFQAGASVDEQVDTEFVVAKKKGKRDKKPQSGDLWSDEPASTIAEEAVGQQTTDTTTQPEEIPLPATIDRGLDEQSPVSAAVEPTISDDVVPLEELVSDVIPPSVDSMPQETTLPEQAHAEEVPLPGDVVEDFIVPKDEQVRPPTMESSEPQASVEVPQTPEEEESSSAFSWLLGKRKKKGKKANLVLPVSDVSNGQTSAAREVVPDLQPANIQTDIPHFDEVVQTAIKEAPRMHFEQDLQAVSLNTTAQDIEAEQPRSLMDDHDPAPAQNDHQDRGIVDLEISAPAQDSAKDIQQTQMQVAPLANLEDDEWALPTKKSKKGKKNRKSGVSAEALEPPPVTTEPESTQVDTASESQAQDDIAVPLSIERSATDVPLPETPGADIEPSDAIPEDDEWALPTKKGKKGKKNRKSDIQAEAFEPLPSLEGPVAMQIALGDEPQSKDLQNMAEKSTLEVPLPETPDVTADDEWAAAPAKKGKKGKKGKKSAGFFDLPVEDDKAFDNVTTGEAEQAQDTSVSIEGFPRSHERLDKSAFETPLPETPLPETIGVIAEDEWAAAPAKKSKKGKKSKQSAGFLDLPVEDDKNAEGVTHEAEPTPDVVVPAEEVPPLPENVGKSASAIPLPETPLPETPLLEAPELATEDEWAAAPAKKGKKKGRKVASFFGLPADDDKTIKEPALMESELPEDVPLPPGTSLPEAPEAAADHEWAAAPVKKSKKKGKKAANFFDLPIEDDKTNDADTVGSELPRDIPLPTEDFPVPLDLDDDMTMDAPVPVIPVERLPLETISTDSLPSEHLPTHTLSIKSPPIDDQHLAQEQDDNTTTLPVPESEGPAENWSSPSSNKKAKKGKKSNLNLSIEEPEEVPSTAEPFFQDFAGSQAAEPETSEDIWALPTKKGKKGKKGKKALDEDWGTTQPEAETSQEMAEDIAVPTNVDSQIDLVEGHDVVPSHAQTAEDEWAMPSSKKAKKGRKGKKVLDTEDGFGNDKYRDVDLMKELGDEQSATQVLDEEPVTQLAEGSSQPEARLAEDEWAMPTSKKAKKGKKGKKAAEVATESEEAVEFFANTPLEPEEQHFPDGQVIETPGLEQSESAVPSEAQTGDDEWAMPTSKKSKKNKKKSLAITLALEDPAGTPIMNDYRASDVTFPQMETQSSAPEDIAPAETGPATETAEDLWATPSTKKGNKGKKAKRGSIVPDPGVNDAHLAGVVDENLTASNEALSEKREPTFAESDSHTFDGSPATPRPTSPEALPEQPASPQTQQIAYDDVFATPMVERLSQPETPADEVFATPQEPDTFSDRNYFDATTRSHSPTPRRQSNGDMEVEYTGKRTSTGQDIAGLDESANKPMSMNEREFAGPLEEVNTQPAEPTRDLTPTALDRDSLREADATLRDAVAVPLPQEDAPIDIHEPLSDALAERQDDDIDPVQEHVQQAPVESQPYDEPPISSKREHIEDATLAEPAKYVTSPSSEQPIDIPLEVAQQGTVTGPPSETHHPIESFQVESQPPTDEISQASPAIVEEQAIPVKLSKKDKKKSKKSKRWEDAFSPSEEPSVEAPMNLSTNTEQAELSREAPLEEEFFLPAKLSKKDKKKAKKAAVWEESDPLPQGTPVESTSDSTAHLAETIPAEPDPAVEFPGEEQFALPVKLSKKDKKKAKKAAAAWDEPDTMPEEPQGRFLADSAIPLIDDEPAVEAPENEFVLPTKLSKKDKKKAKKATIFEDFDTPDAGESDTRIPVSADQPSQPVEEQAYHSDNYEEQAPVAVEAPQYNLPIKLSKKDKKKAKNMNTFDEDWNTQMQESSPLPGEMGKALEPLVEDDASHSAPQQPLAEIGDQEAEEVFTSAPTKLSKEDKKNTFEDSWEPQVQAEEVPIGLPVGEGATQKSYDEPVSHSMPWDKAFDMSAEQHFNEPSSSAPVKLSKKDKKAKKATAFEDWDESSLQDDTSLPLSAETATEELTDTGVSRNLPQDGTTPETPVEVEVDDFTSTASAKLSKKDKKKAKKGVAWDDTWLSEIDRSSAAAPPALEFSPQSDNMEMEATKEAAAEPLPASRPVSPLEPTIEPAEPVLEVAQESESTFEIPRKLSKKDKKKAKKSKTAEDFWQTEEITETPDEPSKLEESATADNVEKARSIDPVDVAMPPSAPPVTQKEDYFAPAQSSKKSKKDKKKAKKSLSAWDEIEPSAEQGLQQDHLTEPVQTSALPETHQPLHEEAQVRAEVVDDMPATDPCEDQKPLQSAIDRDVISTETEATDPHALEESNTAERTNDEQQETRGTPDTAPERLPGSIEVDTSGSRSAPQSNQDIDFAATLAAGLADSGFNPNLVVDDPVFHRRSSPPGMAEADPEEAFPVNMKKTKKSKKVKGASSEEKPTQEMQSEVTESNELAQPLTSTLGVGADKDDYFSAALSAGLAASGFASNLLAGRTLDEATPIEEPEEFSFAVSKKKKGKKGKKSAPLTPGIDESTLQEAPTMSHPSELPTIDTSAVETSTPRETLTSPLAQEPPTFLQTVAEDEWALASKKIGKKSKQARFLQNSQPEDEGDSVFAATETTSADSSAPQAEIPHQSMQPTANTTHETEPASIPMMSPTSKIANLFPDLPRVKRRTQSITAPEVQEPTQDGEESTKIHGHFHTSEASQSVPTLVSDRAELQDDTRPIDQPLDRATPSTWSSDNLRDSGLPSTDPQTPGQTAVSPVRDSGYHDGEHGGEHSRESMTESPREPPTSRPTSTHEQRIDRSGRSSDPLRVSIELNPGWNLPVSKHRKKQSQDDTSDAALPQSQPSPSRKPSPVESTTKDRTSYLFSSPPEGLNDGDPSKKTARHSQAPRSIEESSEADTTPRQPRMLPHIDTKLTPSIPAASLKDLASHVPLVTPVRKKSRAISDVGSPEQGTKSARRGGTPLQSFRERLNSGSHEEVDPFVSNTSQLSTNSPSSFWQSAGEDRADRDLKSRRALGDLRSLSAQSNKSAVSGSHFPASSDQFRTSSVNSNRSITPNLRRVDRSVSGDLRAASRRGGTPGPKTITIEPPPTPPLQEDEDSVFNGPGSTRAKDMSNVLEGWGDVRGSSMSPTRPPSVRKRQSMHIVDLQTRLDQLVAENQQLHDAQADARQAHFQNDSNGQALQAALQARNSEISDKDGQIQQLRAILEPLQQEVARLTELNGSLSEQNKNLIDDTNNRYASLQAERAHAQQQWEQSTRELEGLKQQHGQLASGMEDIVRQEIARSLEDKNLEIRRLREDLVVATEQIRALQAQILESKTDDYLSTRDEDYFDTACQKLCQHVQQWILRFSKYSDNRMCRLTSDIADEKIEARLDKSILDGTDVDKLLADRVRRRDIFMSIVMSMIWEYVFTRYLFGMDREQRQKLKALEKILAEVGPQRAVSQWRATTLTLLSQRPAFATQRNLDTEAVAQEIFSVLSTLLPPPSQMETQILTSLRNVLRLAVDLSIEMRTQRAEYIMLPPLQPEWDPHGDLVRKVHFNASLMNERSGEYSSNDELARSQAVVKIVLFPLVVKKGNDIGEGDDEIVVCPAQVLVSGAASKKKVVRVLSGAMDIDEPRRSKQSLLSTVDSNMI